VPRRYDPAIDRRQALAIFRAVTAIVVIAAIAYQVVLNVDSGLFRPLRFFAFFTILSNGFAAILWLWLAATWRRERTRTEDLLRGAATLYLVVTFIVVVILLSGAELQVADPRVDFIVHKAFPVLVVLDWLIDPPETDLRMQDVALWLIFPLVWVAVTLVRGALDNWYPYPFLDPDHGGYGSVGYHVLAIFAGFLVIAGIVVALGDFGRDRRIRIARSRPVVDG
jgi:hypothetical protein